MEEALNMSSDRLLGVDDGDDEDTCCLCECCLFRIAVIYTISM